MATREIFLGLGPSQIALFYAIGTASVLAFLYGIYRHVAKYRRGRATGGTVDLRAGIARMVSDVLSQRTVRRRDHLAGLAHAGIFFGFLFGFIGTSLIFLDYDILRPLFGVSIWQGPFYLAVSLVLDLGHLGLVLGLIVMMWRRGFLALPKLDYRRTYRGEENLRSAAVSWRNEDWLFVLALLLVEVSGFVLEGARLLAEQPAWAAWSPVGNAVAALYAAAGMSADTAESLRASSWWLHGVLGLAFTAAIPWYKAKHIVSVLGSLAVRDPRPLSRLPAEAPDAESAGIATVADFSWKDMLNLDACTKCGRCHEACPARTAGYPLSPRDLILDLRLHNDERQGRNGGGLDLIGGVIEPDTLWACRTCGACQEICPVGIEHPSMIVRMRRQLVERGDMDPMLQTTLGTIGDTGNSFGESGRKRAAWTRELEFSVKDIREQPADNLWFVGDYASFDPRNQKVSQTVARLFKAGGIDFGLLHEGEWTAGNDVRRTGEEGLYESLVEHNLAAMASSQPFQRIITTDPHSYNTIRNEYPDFGDVAPIEHYTTVLADLLRTGRLAVTKPLGRRVTFHDPCHLGRLNGGYDAPREVLRLIGCEVVEMPRNRDNSFCCGAGGGRIWIPDQPGEKPSENRMHEAAALGPIDTFVTCCPKDLTMFEDARKTSRHEDDFVVQDLAELVAEAVELKSITLADVPPLAERITDAVANRIADVVAARLDQVIADRFGALTAPAAPAAHPETAAQADGEPAPVAEPAAGVEETASPETGAAVADRGGDAVPVPSAPVPVALRPMDWDTPAPVEAAPLEPYEIPEKEGLRILVAVKHAAVMGDEHEFTDDGRDIRGEYLEYTLNEWDDAALEEALQLTEKIGGGEVVAVTVGPEDAETSLRKVLAKGAHRGVRVWDDSLIGADPLTVARAIAGVARLENPDLVMAGVQSSDHAHGATGTAVARILGLPHAAVVVGCDWDGGPKIRLTRELEGGTRHSFELSTPAVLTIQTGINEPRYATMRMIKQARKKPLVVVDGSAVNDGSAGYAVRRMYVPESTRAEMLTGSPDEIASVIAGIIREKTGS